MLGWHISVYKLRDYGPLAGQADLPETVARCSDGDEKRALVEGLSTGERIAVWPDRVRGLSWIHQIVENGRGIAARTDGYPCTYFAQASDVIDSIVQGPPAARKVWGFEPGDVLGPGWEGKTVVDADLAASCSPEEWLFVEAWDES